MAYIVRPGDTLGGIAASNALSLSDLLAANPRFRGNPNLIRIGQTIALPDPPHPAASPVHGVCEAALQLIVMFEVSSPQEYRLHYQTPSWPGGESGVTIGIGYDLGYVSAAQFRADWAGHADAASLPRLAAVCGLAGAAAAAQIAALADIAIDWAAAEDMFRRRTLPETARQTALGLSNTEALAAESFGALVSLVYNRGAAFTASGDRWREMRAIHGCMAARDFIAIPAQFRSMKRLWQDQPGMQGLVIRREREAALFERGLASLAPPKPALSPGA